MNAPHCRPGRVEEALHSDLDVRGDVFKLHELPRRNKLPRKVVGECVALSDSHREGAKGECHKKHPERRHNDVEDHLRVRDVDVLRAAYTR